MSAFNLNKGNQAAQSRLKLQKERAESDEMPMPDARRVPLKRLRSNPFQVRQFFDEEALQELADDIRERDILEPLVVRPILEDGQELYEIVAGERRFRAARLAGKNTVPVIVKENWTENDARLANLAENLQRRDLTLAEEVQFLQALENEYNYTAAKISKLINKSSSYVNRRLQLARDPQKLKELTEKSISLNQLLNSREPENVETEDATVKERLNPKLSKQQAEAAYQVRFLTFTRFREALYRLERELENRSLEEGDRIRLFEELVAVEERAHYLRSRLETHNR